MQAKCLETNEAVAIKKVLQDKRYKNRELQIIRALDHPNIVQLKHCFYSTTDKYELYLNLVLEYVSETIYRITKHYSRMNQHVPLIFVQLYTYQVIFMSFDLLIIIGCIFFFFNSILDSVPIFSPDLFYLCLCVDLSCSCLPSRCYWCVPS